ncbi:MAG: hypothetical protein AT716_03975 [Vulcanisaeta sp. MG_3]|nr:MAG: hypothetical protein AT716_03975 [Vulcanisaeta sp. MG_3]
MEPRFREGNVRRSELGKLWVSGFRVFRGRPIPKDCAGCPFQRLCRGGCPARAYAKLGSFNHPDPYRPFIGG